MKKSIVLLLIAVMMGLSLAGEGWASSSSLPKNLYIGTHPVGNLFNVLGTAVASVVTKHTPMTMKVKAMGGSTAWMPMMFAKEVEFGVINAADCHPAYLGEKPWKKLTAGKGYPVRVAATGLVNSVCTVVSGDCPAKTIPEFKGLRLCGQYSASPTIVIAQAAVLANGGLTWDDVKMVPAPHPAAAVKAVIEGRADGAWSSVGMPATRELAAKRGARFLSLDPSPEALARIEKIYPYNIPQLHKAGSAPGIDVDTWTIGFEIYIVTRPDLPDNAIYEINKALWDYYQELGAIHPKFKGWNQKSFVSRKLFTPYHPGGVRFLKEKGLWSDKLEARQQELLSIKK